ncbi:alpha/beta fold hydrolase [Nocardia tengchongensis]|uniref:alpha/beta fold hydrolase n=1 Tax=Nocardia tengchongensis TaxID=2055889 RepID=UPI0036AF105E
MKILMVRPYHFYDTFVSSKKMITGRHTMAKIGRFKNEQAKSEYLRAYDAVAAQWPVAAADLDIETSFGTTRVRKSGTGEGAPIVMLPGMPGMGLFWMPFIEELSREHVVYVVDPLGWAGRSEQTAPLEGQDDIVRWLIEVFDGLGAERVHLAGYSGGSWLSLLVASQRSDRLASISMLEPDAASFIRPKWGLLFKFLLGGIRPTREKMAKFTQWLTPGIELTDDMWALTLAAIKFRIAMPWSRTLTDEQLAGVSAPMLVLFGAQTVVNDPQEAAARARTMIPAADIEIIPGVGHEMLWAIPETVIPRFLGFVEQHDRVQA